LVNVKGKSKVVPVLITTP